MPEVRLVDVSKRFDRIVAISDFSLEIENGEYICVLGPTGSGKTSLLRLIAGLIQPDGGEILIDGRSVNKIPSEERDVAYMPQQYSLFPHMTVANNVAFGPLSRGKDPAEVARIVLETLRLVRLSERADAFPNELSGGMQQRVALARGLASGAKLMLLDEPLGALDARLRVELRYRLKNMVKSLGLTAIHVTHDQREAMVVADRIVVLRAGRCEQVGTPYHLYQHPDSLFVANFVGDTNFLEGTVLRSDSTGAFVQLRGGLNVRVEETSFLPGERVVLTIRQELTSVKSPNWEGINALPGTIQAVRFLGDYLRIEIRLTNGDSVGSKIPITNVQEYPKSDEKVVVSFQPTDLSAYTSPAQGLAKEVEVI
jgi:ABC-type Fe3+/spermidine/putrescine transport system ATPase subunit